MLILLPFIRCLSVRTRLIVGLALTTLGIVLLAAAVAHGVMAVIVGGIVLLGVVRGRRGARPIYRAR